MDNTAGPGIKAVLQSDAEEFYSTTQLPVITPSNFVAWCKHIGGRRFRFGFRELFSGSGRLSLAGYKQLLCISPPFDHRYGWDLRVAQHQNMIDNSFLDLAIAN